MEQDKSSVFVTEAALPPEETFLEHMRGILRSRQFTNHGALVARLERQLRDFLGLPRLDVCSNGTAALQLAIRVLGLNGKKVITTPFTYVASVTSLLWENCEPVFADIDPGTLCIDPVQVEACLEKHPDAAGILPVHVYGNACAVSELAGIAAARGARLLYDGAHAFGSRLAGKSLLAYGDAATCSFHATKIFHTAEGGCVVTHTAEEENRLWLLRAFGQRGEKYFCPGINAKMSELNAAMGLSLLPEMPRRLQKLARLAAIYDEALHMGSSPLLRSVQIAPGLAWNHAYYPIILASSRLLERVLAALAAQDIHPRRYFYPAMTKLPYIHNQSCPVAEDICQRVLCLPFWADMPESLPLRVAEIVRKAIEA